MDSAGLGDRNGVPIFPGTLCLGTATDTGKTVNWQLPDLQA